jgi:hypothetical protein
MFVGEVWLDDPARLALYLRPDELHSAFAFEVTDPDWDADGFRDRHRQRDGRRRAVGSARPRGS